MAPVCDQCACGDVKVSIEEVRDRGKTLVWTCQRCGTAWRDLSRVEEVRERLDQGEP